MAPDSVNSTSSYNTTYAGNTTGNNLDNSWIVKISYSSDKWVLVTRRFRIIFGSTKDVRFYNQNSNVKFDFIEEFEGNHIFVEDPNDTDGEGVDIIIQSEVVLSGNSSAQILFESDTSSFERTTLATYDRQNNLGSATFIEIDYKCEIPFLAGWITYRDNFVQRDYTVLVAPSEEWNKIYIDI